MAYVIKPRLMPRLATTPAHNNLGPIVPISFQVDAPITPSQSASRKYPRQFLETLACPVVDEKTGAYQNEMAAETIGYSNRQLKRRRRSQQHDCPVEVQSYGPLPAFATMQGSPGPIPNLLGARSGQLG